jgi:hypothetical protein
MARDRHDRFLKLERPRTGAAGRADPLANDERFEGIGDAGPRGAPAGASVPPPRPETPAPAPPGAADRFRPAPERGIDTAALPEGAQPFTRCARCEMDNSVYARACQNCGADLETPEQRNFNEQFWGRRQAETRAEKAAADARAKAVEGSEAEVQRARREIAARMARREADRVEDELDAAEGGRRRRWGSWDDGGGPAEGWGGEPVPVGIRLLRMIPGTGWKIAAVATVVALPLLLAVFTRGGAQLAGMLVLMLVGGLFSNGRRRWRRW